MTHGDILPVLSDAIRSAASAILFGHWITESGLPADMVALVTEYDLKGWQFLIFINIAMLLLGMFFGRHRGHIDHAATGAALARAAGNQPDPLCDRHHGEHRTGLVDAAGGAKSLCAYEYIESPHRRGHSGHLALHRTHVVLLLIVTYVPNVSTWLPNFVFE